MRSRKYRGIDSESSSYDLSISDLMAALCCVFVLFTIGITTSLKEKNMAANQYNETKVQIASEIKEALNDFIQNGTVEFDEERLILRFSSKSAFAQESPDLTVSFKHALADVFPSLMTALYRSNKKDDIEEVRIEGFSASDAGDEHRDDDAHEYTKANPYIKNFANKKYRGEGSDHDYITGFTLSQQRTMQVLSYCMLTYIKGNPDASEKNWVRSHVSASGYSFVRPLDLDGKEMDSIDKVINEKNPTRKEAIKEKSRRVEIRIKTNADRVIEKYQTKNIEEAIDESK